MKKTKLVGAYYKPKHNFWVSKIAINGSEIHLGCYKTEVEAAMAYDLYVIENRLNRRINFPIEPEITIPNTRWIYSTLNVWALVDDWNYDWLNQYKWSTAISHGTYYFTTTIRTAKGNRNIFMHRFISGEIESGKQIDHKDRNGWNNMEINIRICTQHENARNKAPVKNKTSIYKGVQKRLNRWITRISINGKPTHIGSFLTEIEAAKAYDRVAFDNWGEFAYLNFPEDYRTAI